MENNNYCNGECRGSFDRCLYNCSFLGNGCSGPRTSAMPYERHLEWLRSLRKLRKEQGRSVSSAAIAEATGLSKNTVDNFFAGRNKDVSRSTLSEIENFLIGDAARWPCAMDLHTEEDIVYQDRPETLAALEALTRANEELKHTLDGIHASYQKEIDAIRSDADRKIAFLVKNNDQKDKVIDRLLEK